MRLRNSRFNFTISHIYFYIRTYCTFLLLWLRNSNNLLTQRKLSTVIGILLCDHWNSPNLCLINIKNKGGVVFRGRIEIETIPLKKGADMFSMEKHRNFFKMGETFFGCTNKNVYWKLKNKFIYKVVRILKIVRHAYDNQDMKNLWV